MAFTQEIAKVPDSIGDISIVITDFINPATIGSIDYSVQILQPNGSMFRVATGNLIPHLTLGQIDALIAFMGVLRTKANNELLP